MRALAEALGERMGREPVFEGEEEETALLGDASAMIERLGPPRVGPDQIVAWVAHWVMQGGTTHGKPTKYESRTGRF